MNALRSKLTDKQRETLQNEIEVIQIEIELNISKRKLLESKLVELTERLSLPLP